MAKVQEILDGLIGSAKTQDDLFGSDGILKELSRCLMELLFFTKSIILDLADGVRSNLKLYI